MYADNSATLLEVFLEASFLGGIREIAPGTEEEDNVVVLDFSCLQVIKLVAQGEFKVALFLEQRNDRFLIPLPVMPSASHVENLDFLMMIRTCFMDRKKAEREGK